MSIHLLELDRDGSMGCRIRKDDEKWTKMKAPATIKKRAWQQQLIKKKKFKNPGNVLKS